MTFSSAGDGVAPGSMPLNLSLLLTCLVNSAKHWPTDILSVFVMNTMADLGFLRGAAR